jgi:hypothetical protein
LISEIQKYLVRQGGSSNSNDLITYFKYKIKPQHQELFKHMLKQIAVFKKEEGVWELKEEFT